MNTTPKIVHAALAALALAWFGLASLAQAVSPAPDGGYPGGNTAEGQNALLSFTAGTYNTAVGFFSLRNLNTGNLSTAIGAGALLVNTASENTATGAGALLLNNTGTSNTANGAFALSNNTTGNVNTAIGDSALVNNTTGTNNIAVGFGAGSNVATADHVICIGSDGADVSPSCFIGNIRNVQTANADAIPVLIDSAGQLGTASSACRFKKEIKPMGNASESILGLNPVTFHYKNDSGCAPQFGLIAEEVAESNPDLVVRDENGEIYTVRYDAVNAMLLNEFLKEHRKVEQLKNNFQAKIGQQQNEIHALRAQLEEQAGQIQRVSRQLKAIKPALQVVVNDP